MEGCGQTVANPRGENQENKYPNLSLLPLSSIFPELPIGQAQEDTKRKRSSLIRSIQVRLLLGPEQVEGRKRLDLEEQTEDI